jgi:predicted outer membrane repeat protein
VLNPNAAAEAEGHGQLYLSSASNVFELELDLSELDDDHDLNDGFTLTLTNGAFNGTYITTTTNGNADDAACTTTWDASGVGGGVLAGDVLCAGAGVNHDTTIPFAITLPSTGPVVLDVDTTGEDFSVYFFVAEASDTIYVGTSVIADGDGSCGDGGPDFSSDASGQGSVQDALMSAMLAVDDDGDTIVICGGQYTYTDDFGQYDGDADGAHDKITIRAEEGADAVLDGFNNNQQLMKFLDTDVLIDGIVFYNSGDSAIEVSSSDGIHALRVENSEFHGNLAPYGAAIYAEDMDVTISDSTFGAEEDDLDTPLYSEGYNQVSFEGGALYATSSDLTRAARISVEGSAFVGNGAEGVSGGAIKVFGETHLSVRGTSFIDNQAGMVTNGCGGAIYLNNAHGSQIISSTFTDNYASYTGGAIASQSCNPMEVDGLPIPESVLEIRSSTFTDNRAFCAGGAIESLALRVSSSRFEGNEADDCAGGAIAAPGLSRGTPFELINNRFIENVLDLPGGDSCCSGGAVYVRFDGSGPGANPQIKGNYFMRNSSDTFGGALNLVSLMNVRGISRNTFQGNTAVRGGGISLTPDCDASPIARRTATELQRANRFRANRADFRRDADIYRSQSESCVG